MTEASSLARQADNAASFNFPLGKISVADLLATGKL
jgi:hypothetical protein